VDALEEVEATEKALESTRVLRSAEKKRKAAIEEIRNKK
jgi:hypothetical protein